jgi:SH3 domain-containing protein
VFKLPFSSRAPLALLTCGISMSACHPGGAPTPSAGSNRTAAETVTVRDPDLEQRAAKAEMRLLEKDAQIEDLLNRLEEARREVVRSLAKLETTASRAEAASAMAEAEIAVQSVKGAGGVSPPLEAAQSRHLLDESTAEFNKQNYGGALYLANQAKSVAAAAQGRLQNVDRGAPRAGETPFVVPVPLQAVGRSNVREGPGANFKIAYTVESGAALTGYSYMSDWIRVVDDSGRSGWISRSRVAAQKSD